MYGIDTNLIIANCISFVCAIFTCLSCWTKDRARTYYYQVAQCLVYAVASYFFNSYAGIVTLIVCAARNFLLAKDIYGKKICVSLAVLMLVLGVVCNNSGPVGYIIIAANVIYTLGAFFAKSELVIKLNIMLDLLLWIIYDVFMKDIPSLVADSVAVIVAIVSLFVHARQKKNKIDS